MLKLTTIATTEANSTDLNEERRGYVCCIFPIYSHFTSLNMLMNCLTTIGSAYLHLHILKQSKLFHCKFICFISSVNKFYTHLLVVFKFITVYRKYC